MSGNSAMGEEDTSTEILMKARRQVCQLRTLAGFAVRAKGRKPHELSDLEDVMEGLAIDIDAHLTRLLTRAKPARQAVGS